MFLLMILVRLKSAFVVVEVEQRVETKENRKQERKKIVKMMVQEQQKQLIFLLLASGVFWLERVLCAEE